MHNLYHLVPTHMRGNILYPLNLLKILHPDLYQQYSLKYRDHPSREALLLKKIPRLECLWNDVVQCAPIHPHYLYLALSARGLGIDPNLRFFQIPVHVLPDVPIVICQILQKPDAPLSDTDVTFFDRSAYHELTELPAKTLNWYDQLAATGRKGAWFVGIPHVMVQGTIDITAISMIVWSQPPGKGS